MALVLASAGCSTTRVGYESAPYQLVRAEGDFEIRDYPALALVETPMAGDGDNPSFGRLFRFISGNNEAGQKISMTTPVFMDGAATSRSMAFVMPAKLELARVPKPTDVAVGVREFPPGRFAVLRVSGRRTATNEAQALTRLQTWMAAQGLSASSQPVYAYFDPPWTPPFLRRNEVMLRIAADAK